MSDTDNVEKSSKEELLNYKSLLAFFIPLAITPFFITTTHSFINAAMARLPYPEISIAVYTVVKGLTNAVKAPVFMFMQIIVSMVDDIKSFKTASKFIWTICGFFFVTLVLMGYTPLGGWVLRNLIGLKDPESIEIAYLTMRITCFLPLVETLRNIYRGLIIGHKRTKISSAATAVRLVVIILFLGAAVKFKFIPGVVAGALAWTGGIGIEGIMVLLGVFYFLGSPGKAARELPDLPEFKQKKLRIMDITTFFLPIALMRFLNSTLNPIVQSGIARSPINATQALAAYGVAFGVMRIIGSPVGYLHHCALVYLKNFTVQRWKKVSRFCLLAGLISSAIIGIIAVSPAGYWILRRIIGVSPEIAENGRWVLLAFSFFPLIQSLRESHWGLLMNRRETRYIGIAKGLNALAVFLVIFGSILVMPEKPLLSPAVLGALAFTAGQGVETIIIRYSSLKNIEQVAEAAGPVETKLGDINIPFIK